MAAKKKEIKILDAAAIGFDPVSVGEKNSQVAQSRLELPPSRGKGQVFEGPVEESVARLVKALRQDEKVV
jgi:electron transfer flavoprotein beta subunit